ncbi:GntR family transcriptional regulator [Sediminibacillus massiliensis]|uniref:GntR family transcriptional regulator n=1 Tax=Sediminibacillus massiliensis TaxID=1926277 RepID=UPI0009887ABF|nr:GntR family transcriptional regulator [Sediminibacillus massiliensis]
MKTGKKQELSKPAEWLAIKPENIQSLRDIVVTSLREAIVSGHFQPGDHLKERELSEAMGVSTTPIKEAFRILGHEGLVVTVPRKGTFVSELADVSIHEVQLLRAVVEGLNAKLAAMKITNTQLTALEHQLNKMETLRNNQEVERLVEENTTFHDMIREAAAAPMISRILTNVASFDKAFRKRALEQEKEIDDGYTEHHKIFEAIKAKDGDLAEKLMKQHIMRTAEDVLTQKSGADNGGINDGAF